MALSWWLLPPWGEICTAKWQARCVPVYPGCGLASMYNNAHACLSVCKYVCTIHSLSLSLSLSLSYNYGEGASPESDSMAASTAAAHPSIPGDSG
jgi:hypothetical protein